MNVFLISDRLLDVDLAQVVPTCDVFDSRLVPLVGEDFYCIHRAVKKATRGVVLRSRSKSWVILAKELRPDLPLYVWGVAMRGRGITPIFPADEYRGYGVYYVRDRRDLKLLMGKPVEGLLLDARGFDPHVVELVLKNKVICSCGRCGVVDRLLCDFYREVEVL